MSGKEPKVAEKRIPAGLKRGMANLGTKNDSKAEGSTPEGPRGQGARGWTEKLLTRTTSGAVYTIVILACLFAGVMPTCAIVTAMAWLCCSEFLRLVLVLLLICCAIWYVATPRSNIADVALTAFAPIYTSLLFSCIVLIRRSDPTWIGGLLTLAAMGCIWVSDATAYFVGTKFGHHKLAPKISPNKSVEGFWGGLVGCVAVWVLVWALGLWNISLPLAVLIGACSGVISVVGDLFESRIKRGVGVKDSGDIMPGHGGLLDRSDSMLFGGMVIYVILHLGGVI